MTASLESLDKVRLGKQRVEAQQILNALERGGGWASHTASVMWRAHREALVLYRNAAVRLFVARGGRNTMPLLPEAEQVELPGWWGNELIHASHRARLLDKAPHYRAHGWTERPNPHGYAWPYWHEGRWWINDLRFGGTRKRYVMPSSPPSPSLLIHGLDATLLRGACSLPCCVADQRKRDPK